MPRLERGENEKIDLINDLVLNVKTGRDYEESFDTLLNMFKPLLLSICDKWSKYFNDETHKIKKFDELMADAQYWFMRYTIEKYIIDGEATFNTFIKKHIDQRIRYIYECELKYYTKNLFPDPDKVSRSREDDNDGGNAYEQVVYKYTGRSSEGTIEDYIIDSKIKEDRNALAHRIMHLIEHSFILNDREKMVFKGIVCDGMTHEKMGDKMGVSRTRVTQILKKAKSKIYKLINEDEESWDLIIKADINFKEQ